MKHAICAILFTTLVASASQAGYVGEINLSGSGSVGSLSVNGSSELVGTNLLAATVTLPGGGTAALGGYLDFNTGVSEGTVNGVTTYASSGANFFVLAGTLPAYQGTAPLAASLVIGTTTVTDLGTKTIGGDEEYELSMGFSSGMLSQTASTALGAPYLQARVYTGTLEFTFVVDNALAGSQLLGGTIGFSVPEPSSYAMVVMGGLGLIGLGRRRVWLKRVA
jgi:hypothetical protein